MKSKSAICPACNRRVVINDSGALKHHYYPKDHPTKPGYGCAGCHYVPSASEIIPGDRVLIDDDMSFGEVLRAYRLHAGLTQQQLSAKTDLVNPETISNLERDLMNQHPDFIIYSIEDALELPRNTLFALIPMTVQNRYYALRENNYPAARLVSKLLENSLPDDLINKLCKLAKIT